MVRIEAVSADTQNNGIRLRYFFISVAEPARFFGSARRVVFRIKPENNVFARIIGQRMFLAVASFQIKSRRLLSFETAHNITSVNSISSFLFNILAQSINRIWPIFL